MQVDDESGLLRLDERDILPDADTSRRKDKSNSKAAAEIAGRIKNAKLQVIGCPGHEVNIDAPERLAEIILTFTVTAE